MFFSSFLNLSNKTIKNISLGFCFFFIIGAYTLLRELKDAVFIITVGTQYLPDVKMISIFVMIPMVLFYTWFSERVSRQTLLACYALVFSCGAFIISCFLKDPIIGITNVIPHKTRLFGWFTYLFLEGCSPFLVSLNWSFLNSISNPGDVKNNYIIMAAMGKIGSFIFALTAWFSLSRYFAFFNNFSDIDIYVNLFRLTSCALFLIPFILFYLFLKLPPTEFQGYTDINNFQEKSQSIDKKTITFGSGFALLFKNAYVFSIVGMIFCWEVINVIFNNLRLAIAYEGSQTIGDLSLFLFKSTVTTSLISLFFVIIGTNSVIRFLGERKALLFIPLVTGIIMISFLLHPTPFMVIFAYTFIRAINLSLTTPIRESLYIPTSKEIQFKTKSWIDSFGQKFSKGCGSLYNKIIQFLPLSTAYYTQIGFFVLIVALWTYIATFLGKKWEKAVKEKKIIK